MDVYVSVNSISHDIHFDDSKLIRFHPIQTGDEDNWGDDDCYKMVTDVYECAIDIDASIADQFINVDENGNKSYKTIHFVRYGYYHPAYHITKYNMHKTIETNVTVNDDGSLRYHIKQSA